MQLSGQNFGGQTSVAFLWQFVCTVVALEPYNSAVKTVLVVDNDLGFLFWLGKTLETAGYNVVPAVSIPKAHSLLSALTLVPDLLIISPTFLGGADLIAILRRDWPGLRVVAAVDEDTPDASRIPVEVDRWIRKPPGLILAEGAIFDEIGDIESENSLKASRAAWLLVVRMALEGNATSAD